MKPVIGITPSAQIDAMPHGEFRRYCLSAPYVRAIERAGGAAVILPPQQDAAEPLVSLLDGLLLSGGPDIEPKRYGDATIHPDTYGIDPERDQFEIDLFHAAMELDVPVFGICRGIQVLNVALGGTLIQDVASEHPGAANIGHRQHERGLDEWRVGHSVTVTPSSLLITMGSELGVNSFHHQAIRNLAHDLQPIAFSPDGLIEAVVMVNAPNVFGVQWHPELMFERDEIHLRAFVHLVEAAAVRRLVAARI